MLQRGASRVYAVDVGYGVLDWRLRNDSRVILLERTNARTLGKLPEPVDFIAADVSFISLKAIIPTLAGWYASQGGEAVLLIKPQFEATQEESARGAGVITDHDVQRRVTLEVLDFAGEKGFETRGVIRSPLKGPAGNQEFLAWLSYGKNATGQEGWEEKVNALF
jgi:23S rRNA (cytidine1920-2'-O)/16S rRNA (cytidine1409-2'-O)-methyltransferase